MTKLEFLTLLRERLASLPQNEVYERLSFYSEMIDDRMEDGLTEDEAVACAGNINDIAAQITADIPLTKILKDKIRQKKCLNALEIVLLILGAPIWLSLLITAISVVFALYASLCAIVIAFWSVFAAILCVSLGALVSGIVFILTNYVLSGVAMFGASLICAGLAIFSFFGCKAATSAMLLLGKKAVLGIKYLFIGKDRSK